MFKIGLIGSDNSHGLGFAQLCNLPNERTGTFLYPGIRITAIYGHEKERTEQVAKDGAIEKIYENANDMIGNVDAVMVIFRHGSKHAKYTLPFIEAGIPVWVDKPFTSNIAEAEAIVEAAKRKNVLITGGSAVIHSHDVKTLAYIAQKDIGLDRVVAGYLNFPGDIHSEYDGIFFYGPHSVEMMMTIFGNDVKSVVSTVVNEKLVVVARYNNFHVVLNFVQSYNRTDGIVYGENKTVARQIDSTTTLQLGFEEFYEMLKTKTIPRPIEDQVLSVKILTAIDKSVKQGGEVFI
jgi:predicted dehydrogenase